MARAGSAGGGALEGLGRFRVAPFEGRVFAALDVRFPELRGSAVLEISEPPSELCIFRSQGTRDAQGIGGGREIIAARGFLRHGHVVVSLIVPRTQEPALVTALQLFGSVRSG